MNVLILLWRGCGMVGRDGVPLRREMWGACTGGMGLGTELAPGLREKLNKNT